MGKEIQLSNIPNAELREIMVSYMCTSSCCDAEFLQSKIDLLKNLNVSLCTCVSMESFDIILADCISIPTS